MAGEAAVVAVASKEEAATAARTDNNRDLAEGNRRRTWSILNRNAPEANPPKTWGSFDLGEFRSNESTGSRVSTPDNRDAGQLESNELQANFDEELHARYGHFLESHIKKIQRIYRDNNALYQRMEASQTHRYETKLMDFIAERDEKGEMKVNDQGELVFSADKIQNLLSTPDGWKLTTMLIEQQTSLQLFALGLSASLEPRGNRDMVLGNQSIDLGIDQGVLREVMRDAGRYLGEQVPTAGGRNANAMGHRWEVGSLLAGATAVGGVFGGSLGGPLGAVAGALITPGAVALNRLLKRGVGMDVRQCAQVLDSIKNNPRSLDADYLRAAYNIDIDDFTTQAGVVELVDGPLRSTMNAREVRRDMVGNIYSRLQFYNSLHVPMEQLDAIPEQFIFRYVNGDPEQTATHWQREIMDTFNQLGGVQQNDTLANNGRRFRQARVDVMVRTMERLIDREVNVKRHESQLSDLKAAINERTNATYVPESKKQAQLKIESLNKQKAALPKAEAHQQYQAAQEQVAAVQERVVSDLNVAIVNNKLRESIQTQIDALNTQLRNPQYDITNPNQNIGLEDALDALEINAQTQIQVDIQQLQGNQQPNNRGSRLSEKDISRMVDTVFKRSEVTNRRRREQLIDSINKAKERRDQLLQAQKDLDNATRALRQAERAIVNDTPRNLNQITAAYDTLFVFHANVPNPLNADILRNNTVDQVVQIINAPGAPFIIIYPANVVTPQERTNYLRTLVLQARAEVMAREIETYEPSPLLQAQHYNTYVLNPQLADGVLPTISQDNILGMPDAQIEAQLVNTYTVDQDQVANVRQELQSEARKRLRIRNQILVEQQTLDLDNQIKAQETLMSADFKDQLVLMNQALKVAERQGKIFYATNRLTSAESDTILSGANIDANNTAFQTAEVTLNAPQGYYEIANILFGYQNEPNRAQAFNDMIRLMPPDRLADYLNRYLNLGLLAANASGAAANNILNINNALAQMRNRIRRPGQSIAHRHLGLPEMQQAFRNISDQLIALAVRE